MTALEYLKVVTELGAMGVLGVVVWLFVKGKVVSEQSVMKLMEAQTNHIGDLRDDIKAKMNEMIKLLQDIRDNGAMNKKK
ncbi:unnamed protein product [marine sediment metagenome]|uniref:Uncharacterized protein n=1 Tax=marine sediment metagenome TaxID=412755 RepID=X1LBE4_9ZZZZ